MRCEQASMNGRLDIVIANAGIMDMQRTPYEASEQAWQDSLDVMLTGTWIPCKGRPRRPPTMAGPS